MSKNGTAVLTLAQIAFGGATGAVIGLIGYFIMGSLLWGKLLAHVISGGVFYAIFVLITFLITYGVVVVCVGEAVRLVAYWMQKETIPRKIVYQGVFLGIPAAAALISMATYDWSSMDMGLFPGTFILGIIRIIASIVSAPVKVLLFFKFPPILMYIIAAPVGAIVGYRLAAPEQLAEDSTEYVSSKSGSK